MPALACIAVSLNLKKYKAKHGVKITQLNDEYAEKLAETRKKGF